jgi:hypothetical protein
VLRGHYVNTTMRRGGSASRPNQGFLSEWGANVLIVTKSIDPCLWVFTPDEWEKMEKMAAAFPW